MLFYGFVGVVEALEAGIGHQKSNRAERVIRQILAAVDEAARDSSKEQNKVVVLSCLIFDLSIRINQQSIFCVVCAPRQHT